MFFELTIAIASSNDKGLFAAAVGADEHVRRLEGCAFVSHRPDYTEMTSPSPRWKELQADGYIVKPCKGCAKPMVWGMKETGDWLPLDPIAPVYTIATVKDRDGNPRQHAIRNMLSFVLHHVTCPKREMFSGNKA